MSVELFVVDTGGDGPPVLLIHGWPLSSRAWEKQMGALSAAGYRAIAYDRRGFGRSEKPDSGYDYNTLAADTAGLIERMDLQNVTLVGFSMGGGEVARYVANHGEDRLAGVVFAGAVPPYMMKTVDNPEGPLTEAQASEMKAALEKDRAAFFDDFTRKFFSADGALKVTESERLAAVELCLQSDQTAALGCMKAFGTTDFRDDLTRVTVPTLVLHGGSDGIVPFEGSGARTHRAIPGSRLEVVDGAPHGFNVSHADAFNRALLSFLDRPQQMRRAV
jgi:non-heme chloroperoxidase